VDWQRTHAVHDRRVARPTALQSISRVPRPSFAWAGVFAAGSEAIRSGIRALGNFLPADTVNFPTLTSQKTRR
jgi:hypothetical protein